MTDGTREMTLDEVVDTLPPGHRARRDLALLHFTNDVLRDFRHSTKRLAENTYQRIDSFGVQLREEADQRRGTGQGVDVGLAGAAGWGPSNGADPSTDKPSEGGFTHTQQGITDTPNAARRHGAPTPGIYKGGSCE